MRPLLPLAALALLLAGCNAPPPAPPGEVDLAADCGDEAATRLHALPLPREFHDSTLAAPWDTLVYAPDGFGQDLLRVGVEGNPAASATITKLPGGKLANLTIPGVFAKGTAWAGWGSGPDRQCAFPYEPVHTLEWNLTAGPAFPPAAEPGKGVHVLTAGFLGNGTLFYTNIAALDQSDLFPRWEHYAWEGDAPLPVYVYDQSPDEQPPHWKAPSRNLPADTPAEPAFAVARSVLAGPESDAGLGYFPTIRGFNEALKDLPLSTTRVVHIAPEDAYTQADRTDHVLYGASLTFVVKAVAVMDAPCPPAVADRAECASPLP